MFCQFLNLPFHFWILLESFFRCRCCSRSLLFFWRISLVTHPSLFKNVSDLPTCKDNWNIQWNFISIQRDLWRLLANLSLFWGLNASRLSELLFWLLLFAKLVRPPTTSKYGRNGVCETDQFFRSINIQSERWHERHISWVNGFSRGLTIENLPELFKAYNFLELVWSVSHTPVAAGLVRW